MLRRLGGQHFCAHDLERDQPIQRRLFGEEHGAHAAFTQPSQQTELAECLVGKVLVAAMRGAGRIGRWSCLATLWFGAARLLHTP